MKTERPRPAPERRGAPSKRTPAVRLPGLEFPGCRPVYMTREDVAGFGRRLEFWGADPATAWVCGPTSPYHEHPSRRLTRLVERIATVRGAPLESFGHMDLRRRDRCGRARRIMAADEALRLHPTKMRLPGLSALVVGEDDLPDVVLEVDHSTAVRRGELQPYEAWGFPEVWVEVPERCAPSRPRNRRPGPTIQPLEGDVYQTAVESRALPGWRADEIHTALNEGALSAATVAALARVGAALGAREGTGPHDDPQLGRRVLAGVSMGRNGTLAASVRQVPRARSIEISQRFPTAVPGLAATKEETAVNVPLARDSEADFGLRIGGARGWHQI